MIEEIKTDNNCIVKAFENNPIAILQEDVENKKVYYFKASDIGKALGIVNIHSTIQNYEDEDERVIRKAYDPQKNLQDTTFLTSQGVYRLLYNSKKEIAKKFRKWAGNILDDIIFNESSELKKQLQEKEQLLLEKDQVINQLENKPETNGFIRKSGHVYMISDTTKKGHIKIGFGDPDNRVISLNVGSSTYSLEVKARFETTDVEFLEKIIHQSLNPFRIIKRKEWFYFKNDFELAYCINVIKKCVDFVETFNIIDYESLKYLNKTLDINKELDELNKEVLIKKEVYKKNTIYIKSDIYIGVFFLQEKNKWISKLQDIYLGIFDTELDAAKTYNDYIMYINENNNDFNYILNNIPDYISVPRNIIGENYIHENKICIPATFLINI